MPQGGGTNHQVYLMIGGQEVYSDVSSGRVSYAAPGDITATSVGSDGSLVITGSNFGNPASVILQNGEGINGHDIDLGTCIASSFTTMTCATGGAGTNWQVRIHWCLFVLCVSLDVVSDQ